MYRTLIGFYFTAAGLTFKERNRRINVIPFTLSPHSSNIDSVVDAVRLALRTLDAGKLMPFPDSDIIVYLFTFFYTSDMP